MQNYGSPAPARNGAMNPAVPVPEHKAPKAPADHSSCAKPGNKGGPSTGFTGSLKPGKI